MVVCNVDFPYACSTMVCNTLTKMKYDHYPILLSCNFEEVRFMSQFKFTKIWFHHEECIDVIK